MASNKEENSKRLLRQSIIAADTGESLREEAMLRKGELDDPAKRIEQLREARAWIELSIELVVSSENV